MPNTFDFSGLKGWIPIRYSLIHADKQRGLEIRDKRTQRIFHVEKDETGFVLSEKTSGLDRMGQMRTLVRKSDLGGVLFVLGFGTSPAMTEEPKPEFIEQDCMCGRTWRGKVGSNPADACPKCNPPEF